MATSQKRRLLFAVLLIFLSENLLAAVSRDISINYLNNGKVSATVSVDCTDHNGVCQSTLIFSPDQNTQNKAPASCAMNAQGIFHRGNDHHSALGSITVEKNDKSTRLPLSIDYHELPAAHWENPVTRALIAHLHPALIDHARKELDQITEVSDYLTGTSKNSETLHLFRPEPHTLNDTDVADLTKAIDGEFLVLDLGDSYSMVLTFDADNMPVSVYVLDRWKLYRNQAVKTVIDYGDLVGLVLHGMDFIQHSRTLLGMSSEAHTHFTTLERLARSVGIGQASLHKLISLIGAGFHVAEIIDHSHGVSEFISGSQRHYLNHDHSMWANIFGVMHLGHTFFELATDRSLPHGIETVLAVASFAYHHVPHHYYEYPLSQVIQPVMRTQNNRLL